MKERYPHHINIEKCITEVSPYEQPLFFPVFGSKCRCFLLGQSDNGTEIKTNTYKVIIPGYHLGAISENFKVYIFMKKNSETYDLSGYVTNVAQYDRVCEVYFEEIKDNKPIMGGV